MEWHVPAKQKTSELRTDLADGNCHSLVTIDNFLDENNDKWITIWKTYFTVHDVQTDTN